MGKYAATRGIERGTREFRGPHVTLTDNPLSEWLYGSWSQEKLREYELLSVIPGVSQYMDYLLSIRADDEYLRRYGMDYSDIHDPRKLRQTSSGTRFFGSALTVSENIGKLYL